MIKDNFIKKKKKNNSQLFLNTAFTQFSKLVKLKQILLNLY